MTKKITQPISKTLKHQIIFIENIALTEIEQDNWQRKFETFAEIKPITDNSFESLEGLNFGHIITQGFFLFKIRFIAGITNKMRILFKNRQFEIKRIINIGEQDRVIQIIALEI